MTDFSKRWRRLSGAIKAKTERRKYLLARQEELEDSIADNNRERSAFIKAGEVVGGIENTLQEIAQARISNVVSKSLKVFGDYEFRISFASKRGGTAATFILIKEGIEVDPMDCGGGVIDVIAFALRLSVLMARKPKARPILFLDEPFKFVSENYRSAVGDMLEQLSEALDFQFIIVTHIPELFRGNIIEVK